MTGLPFWEMPGGLVIGGVYYPIRTDFRVGIRIRQRFWEPYYRAHETALVDGIGRLLFSDAVPGVGAHTELLCAVLWYLLDGRISSEHLMRRLTGERGAHAAELGIAEEAVFSYLWDMPAVYAAFLGVYRIDLLQAQMHLWQFDALFAGLPEESTLRRTVAVRGMTLDAAEDDGARAALAVQKLHAQIPDQMELLRIGCDAAAHSRIPRCSFADKDKTGRDSVGGALTLRGVQKNNNKEE